MGLIIGENGSAFIETAEFRGACIRLKGFYSILHIKLAETDQGLEEEMPDGVKDSLNAIDAFGFQILLCMISLNSLAVSKMR